MFRIAMLLAAAVALFYARKQWLRQRDQQPSWPITTATEEAESRGAEAAAAEMKRQAEQADRQEAAASQGTYGSSFVGDDNSIIQESERPRPSDRS